MRASAANAIIDSLRSNVIPHAGRNMLQCGDLQRRQLRGRRRDLISSFPLTSERQDYVEHRQRASSNNEFAQGKLNATVAELRDEQKTVADLLKK